jgi:hypothetical protein
VFPPVSLGRSRSTKVLPPAPAALLEFAAGEFTCEFAPVFCPKAGLAEDPAFARAWPFAACDAIAAVSTAS